MLKRILLASALLSLVFALVEISFASNSHWLRGSGVGSQRHWLRGSGVGSQRHWLRGSGVGSQRHWLRGSGLGSQRHWLRGSGLTFPDRPMLDTCLGLMKVGQSFPQMCTIYPTLEYL